MVRNALLTCPTCSPCLSRHHTTFTTSPSYEPADTHRHDSYCPPTKESLPKPGRQPVRAQPPKPQIRLGHGRVAAAECLQTRLQFALWMGRQNARASEGASGTSAPA